MRPLFATTARLLFATGLVLGAATPALAQDDDDDFLDDILAPDDQGEESTIASERQDVLRGDIDDQVGTESDVLETPGEQGSRRIRPIKVLQPKKFLKIGRVEVGPQVGFVTNDPFVNVFLVGATATYHATEVLGVELNGIFSPAAPYKPITNQLVRENQVSPDVSYIQWGVNANLMYSPIFGKVAVGENAIITFDIFGVFGTGIVQTFDDLEALQRPDDPVAQATAKQYHPTSNVGGGARIGFGKNIAVRIEGRSMIYIETVASTTLELKNAFVMQGGVTFFFPGMK